MAVHVHFMSTRNISKVNSRDTTSAPAPGIAGVRKREALALGAGVTAAAALAGEVILIANEEATSVLVAVGSAPDASATTSTNATSAGFLLKSGQSAPVWVANAGDKVSAKVVS